MSPVFLVSVIDFRMSPAVDTAHDGAVCLFYQTFSNSWYNCVGMDIHLTDTPCIDSWGLLSTLLPPSLPMPWFLLFLVGFFFFCCSFFLRGGGV